MVGADHDTVPTDERMALFLRTFLSAIRAQPALALSTLIVIVERNFGGSALASVIVSMCASFAPLATLTQDPTPRLMRAGVVTTHDVKERMRVSLATMLRARSVHYSHPFVSTRPDARDALTQQLRGYRYLVQPGKAGGKMVLTGKGAGTNDDLALGLNMLSFWPATHQAEGERCLLR